VLLIRDYLCDIKPVSLIGNRLFCCQRNPGRKGGEIFYIGTWVIEEIFRYHWRLFEDLLV